MDKATKKIASAIANFRNPAIKNDLEVRETLSSQDCTVAKVRTRVRSELAKRQL